MVFREWMSLISSQKRGPGGIRPKVRVERRMGLSGRSKLRGTAGGDQCNLPEEAVFREKDTGCRGGQANYCRASSCRANRAMLFWTSVGTWRAKNSVKSVRMAWEISWSWTGQERTRSCS